MFRLATSGSYAKSGWKPIRELWDKKKRGPLIFCCSIGAQTIRCGGQRPLFNIYKEEVND